MTVKRRTSLWGIGCLCVALFGCSGSNARISPPNISPAGASEKAIELYDADRDNMLSIQELAACPGLLSSLDRYDVNHDSSISSDEIVDRIRSWQETKVALTMMSCKVERNGRPLPSAEVRFVPEHYLGAAVKPAFGFTDSDGMAIIRISDSDLQDDLKGMSGVHYGTYKVLITHPTENLPAKFNSETTLGYEVAQDTLGQVAVFTL